MSGGVEKKAGSLLYKPFKLTLPFLFHVQYGTALFEVTTNAIIPQDYVYGQFVVDIFVRRIGPIEIPRIKLEERGDYGQTSPARAKDVSVGYVNLEAATQFSCPLVESGLEIDLPQNCSSQRFRIKYLADAVRFQKGCAEDLERPSRASPL